MDKKENFMSDNALLYRAAIKYYDNRLKRYDIGYGQVVNLMMIHEHPGITMKELSFLIGLLLLKSNQMLNETTSLFSQDTSL